MSRLRELWQGEPARCVAVLAAVAVFVLAKVGVIVSEQSVGEALFLVVPLLIGGEAVRSQVTPANEPGFSDADIAGAVRAPASAHTNLNDGEWA